MNKDEHMMEKRLIELANIAYNRNIPIYTDFLNLNEQNVYYNISKNLLPPVGVKPMGGYNLAERKIIAFYPNEMEEYLEYPYTTLYIKPSNKKFAQELSHRDFLGAIMNLGIERSKIGDILVKEDICYLFCMNTIADYITENLLKIKNTNVVVGIASCDSLDNYEPNYEEIKGTVASLRLDCIIALAYNSSRSKLTGYITEGKVFVNGKLITSNAYNLKNGDIISVRGYGKFKYIEEITKTKKNKLLITLHKYV